MRKVLIWLAVCACCGAAPLAPAQTAFRFESVETLDAMAALIQARFPLGTPRGELRRTFVDEGHATLKIKPDDPAVEKYLFDIDLCHYYIWRWNISADFDAAGLLRQAYVNGKIVHPGGTPAMVNPKAVQAGENPKIFRIQRPRPEAYKGESSLGAIVLDRDGGLNTVGDQFLMGAGPSRADPANMGTMTVYSEVDPWRSIFDSDSADRIVPFPSSCQRADQLWEAQKQAAMRPGAASPGQAPGRF